MLLRTPHIVFALPLLFLCVSLGGCDAEVGEASGATATETRTMTNSATAPQPAADHRGSYPEAKAFAVALARSDLQAARGVLAYAAGPEIEAATATVRDAERAVRAVESGFSLEAVSPSTDAYERELRNLAEELRRHQPDTAAGKLKTTREWVVFNRAWMPRVQALRDRPDSQAAGYLLLMHGEMAAGDAMGLVAMRGQFEKWLLYRKHGDLDLTDDWVHPDDAPKVDATAATKTAAVEAAAAELMHDRPAPPATQPGPPSPLVPVIVF